MRPADVHSRDSGRAVGGVLAERVEPDLLDEPLMILDAELDHDVDDQVQQAPDVGSP
jgi:hypothetical protein